MTGNPYPSSPSYFSRPATALNSTSYIGSPIASPPVAATSSMSRQLSGSGPSPHDYYTSSSQPRQRAPIDYPSLGIAPQRPPMAAQPNGGAPARPPPAMPSVQRMSSSTFKSEGVSSPTASYSPMSSAAQLSQMVNWSDGAGACSTSLRKVVRERSHSWHDGFEESWEYVSRRLVDWIALRDADMLTGAI